MISLPQRGMLMRLIVVIAAAAAVSGCATVADLRDRTPTVERSSARSVQEIAGCVSQKLSKQRGVSVASTPLQTGTSITVTGMLASSPVTYAVFDVEDLGQQRRLRLFDKRKASKAVGADFDLGYGDCL